MAALLLIALLGVAVAEGDATKASAARTGTLAGRVLFGRKATGVAKVLDATGRLVGHQIVRWGHSRFRFVLKPGRYEVKVEPRRWVDMCPRQKTVWVRANGITHVVFPTGCGSY